MSTRIALFRGINVGGKNRLPMKDLVAILEGLGFRNVRTYIQSGNAVFEAARGTGPGLAAAIRAAVETAFGFEPAVLLLTLPELDAAIVENPFPEAVTDPRTLHVNFLAAAPGAPDLDGLEALGTGSERFALIDRRFYLYAPDGIGRSKLAARAERLLGVPMTGRNWRTVCTLRELAEPTI